MTTPYAITGQLRPQARFTVLELLVTMVIVMIITGIALTSYQKLVVGNIVDTGARRIASEIILGRQTAVTRRRHVAVLFPSADASGIGDMGVDDLYTCYRMAYVDTNSNFVGWVEGGAWIYVPTKVTIMEVDGDLGIQGRSGADLVYQLEPEDNDVTTVDNVDLSELGGSTAADDVRAIIFSPHGRVRGSGSKHITVGAAMYSATGWQIENPQTDPNVHNRSCANQINVEVNRFTGSTRFITPDQY